MSTYNIEVIKNLFSYFLIKKRKKAGTNKNCLIVAVLLN